VLYELLFVLLSNEHNFLTWHYVYLLLWPYYGRHRLFYSALCDFRQPIEPMAGSSSFWNIYLLFFNLLL